MTLFSRSKLFAVLAVLTVLACASFAATPIAVESARAHAAAGAFGCSVNAASVATPSVIGCVAAHNLIDGDQVQITGIGGTSTDNTTAFVKVTGYSTTTFALYQDAGLSTGVTGTGTYTSGGVVTKAQDISGLSGDFSLRLNINGLTAAKNAVVCVQDSADGFVSDIVTLWCKNMTGGASGGFYVPPIGYTMRSYDLPSLRIGVSNARLRLNVTKVDSGGTVTTSLYIEQ